MLVEEKIETETVIFFYEDDILNINFKEDADVKLENAKENLKARKAFQKEEKVKVLSDVSNVWNISKDARAFFATKQVTDLNIAMAMIAKSFSSKILANFFMKFNKPATPTKMFNSKEKALAWLSQFD